MTTAVAAVGVTYDGFDLQEADLGIYLEIVRGLNEPPRVRGEDTLVPDRPFRIPRNRIADSLTVELAGWVRGEGATEQDQREDFRDKVTFLKELFSTERDPATLTATLEDSSTTDTQARPANVLIANVLPSFANVSVELECYDRWGGAGS